MTETTAAARKTNKGFGRHTTRESWLRGAIKAFRPWFREQGVVLPEHVRISTGFAYGTRQENENILGVTYRNTVSEDGVNEIFISPIDGDPASMLATVLHEITHVMFFEDGHRGRFAELMHKFGFEGSLLEVHPNVVLAARLMVIAEELGAYPGSKMNLRTRRTPDVPVELDPTTGKPIRITTGPAPQTARNLKVECAHGGRHHVRTTRGMVETVGMPDCACHHQPMVWA